MSFMSIDGMVLHCYECSSYATVDFVDGSRWTQIGDAGVIYQNELNDKYNTDGKYHVEGLLCSTCYQVVVPDDIEKKRWSVALQLDNIKCNLENIQKIYKQRLFEYLTTILLQWLDEYSFKCQESELFSSIVSDKNIDMKGRLKKLLTSHMHGIVYEKYITKADKMLSVGSLPQVITIVEDYIKDCNPKLEEAKGIYHELGKRDFTMWVEHETGQPINLNPHICAHTTVRTTSPEEKVTFYYNTKVHVANMNPEIEPLRVGEILKDAFMGLSAMTLLRNKLSSEVADELAKR